MCLALICIILTFLINLSSFNVQVIEEVGVKNVVAIVTDSAASCKKAGALVNKVYPSIYWISCNSHILDLCLEDIGKMDWISLAINRVKAIVNFIRAHGWSLQLYRSDAAKSHKLELLHPGELNRPR